MKKFLITNPRYAGEVALIYNEQGILISADFSDTNMVESSIQMFLKLISANAASVADFFTSATSIVEAEVKITWDIFYKDWENKRNAYVGKKVFERLSKTEQVKAQVAKKGYIKYVKKLQLENTEFRGMMADSFLRRKEFNTDWSKQ